MADSIINTASLEDGDNPPLLTEQRVPCEWLIA